MEKKYYVTRTNKRSGDVMYKRFKCSDGFTSTQNKNACWQFTKRGAKNIAAFLNERCSNNGRFEYGIEAVSE